MSRFGERGDRSDGASGGLGGRRRPRATRETGAAARRPAGRRGGGTRPGAGTAATEMDSTGHYLPGTATATRILQVL